MGSYTQSAITELHRFSNLEKTTIDRLHRLLSALGKKDDTVMFTKWKSDRKQKDVLTIIPRAITHQTAHPGVDTTAGQSLFLQKSWTPLWWEDYDSKSV